VGAGRQATDAIGGEIVGEAASMTGLTCLPADEIQQPKVATARSPVIKRSAARLLTVIAMPTTNATPTRIAARPTTPLLSATPRPLDNRLSVSRGSSSLARGSLPNEVREMAPIVRAERQCEDYSIRQAWPREPNGRLVGETRGATFTDERG
jgi:hypothetical protein